MHKYTYIYKYEENLIIRFSHCRLCNNGNSTETVAGIVETSNSSETSAPAASDTVPVTEPSSPEEAAVSDQNGDGIPDAGDGKINAKDKVIIGNSQPLGIGGFSLSGYLYGFDFSANFNYVFGNNIYNANKVEFSHSRKYERRNLLNTMTTDKRWTNIDWATGELITDPDQLAAANAGVTMWSPAVGNAVFSDWAEEDGSFLRLSSATIGYTLPEKLTMKIKMQKLRLYVTGTNLFCLTKYSGYDPEVDTRRATPLTPGVDYSAYPKSIGFVVGANITF